MFDLNSHCFCILWFYDFNCFIFYLLGASGLNTIYTMSVPKGKESHEGFTYDKSLETELALKVCIWSLEKT